VFFGLSIKDVRKLASDLAEKYKLPHTFYKENNMEGKKWFYAFMLRNPQLSVRQPEATSLTRAKGFNRDNVLHFFYLLESNIAKFGFTPDKIFVEDESGFGTVQKRPQKNSCTESKISGRRCCKWRRRGLAQSRAEQNYDASRLAVYRQSVRLGDKPLEPHDQ
jgi:hypothetical protein